MLRRIRISARLAIFLGIILFLILGLGVYSLNELTAVAKSASDLYEHPLAVTSALKEMKIRLLEIQMETDVLLEAKDSIEIQEAVQFLLAKQSEFDSLADTVRQKYSGSSQDVAELMTASVLWQQARDKVVEAMRSGKRTEASRLRENLVRPARLAAIDQIDMLLTRAQEYATGIKAQSDRTTGTSITFVAVFLGLAFVLSALVALVLARSITRPLHNIVELVSKVSQGDLTVDFDISNERDEITSLKRSLRIMAQNLRTQTRETSDGMTTLAAAASQITATGVQLSAAAAETATSITETTVTAEEVKQTAHVAMERTKEVAAAAEHTLQSSRESVRSVEGILSGIAHIRDQMEHIAKSILELNERSRSIGEMIETVDDIAEQSNLLAVNAAIEAAKAGEQGRGFSVVAREIRSLSEQSRGATRQIRSILDDIQKAMQAAVLATEQGNKAADDNYQKSESVGSALSSMIENVETTSQMAQQIIAANQQQYTGIDQVTLAMESIREASRQNVDAARQLEDSAKDLDSLSQKLKKLVGKYSV